MKAPSVAHVRPFARALLATAAPPMLSALPAIAQAETITVKRPDRNPGGRIETLINGEPVAVMVPLEGGIIPIRNPHYDTTVDADRDGLDLYREALLFSHPGDVDSDDDGLDDGVEVLGTDEVDYPRLGANPARRDVFVEIDYEHFQRDGRTYTARLAPAAHKKLNELHGGPHPRRVTLRRRQATPPRALARERRRVGLLSERLRIEQGEQESGRIRIQKF